MQTPVFWTVREGRESLPLVRLLLTPLGWLQGASVARRIARATPFVSGVPVISVGNLTAGGTGKTPLARLLRARLAARLGGPVAVVSRGHGGTQRGPLRVDPARHTAGDVGDEPLMLASDGPVYVGRDRAAAARLAVAEGQRALVLDDGHQNPAVHRHLSLVVVDGATGFGNGRLLPAGPLREPPGRGLARADALILMGEASGDTLEDLAGSTLPRLAVRLAPQPPDVSGRVVGFCGIGRPEKFEDTLKETGLTTVDFVPFPDHHPYRAADLARLARLAAQAEAKLVTTEKDYARLPAPFRDTVAVVRVDARPAEPEALERLVDLALERAGA